MVMKLKDKENVAIWESPLKVNYKVIQGKKLRIYCSIKFLKIIF